jgi:signal transduction histidine kinase
MVAGFAHELNTTVGVAVGAVSQSRATLGELETLIGQDEVSEEELRGCLETLDQSSVLALSNLQRAARLVQSFKRSSVDQVSEQSRRFHVRELLQDVLLALHNQLKNRPIRVQVECPEALEVDGSPGLYEQLLTNLVLNSLQHGVDSHGSAGCIQLRVAELGDERLRLECGDDGIGMSPEVAAKVFEPFFTTRRGQGGTGLGLYLCHSIVTERLGGTIRCETSPGAGARFIIEVPARICRLDAVPAPAS